MLGCAVFYYQEAAEQHLAPPAGLSLELLVDKSFGVRWDSFLLARQVFLMVHLLAK